MSFIFKRKAEASVVKLEESYSVIDYVTRQEAPKFSVAVGRLKGRHWKTMNKASDRAYYIVEGTIKFIFENQTLEAKQGDVVYIRANTPYSMEGTGKAVLINSPPFDPTNEVKLE